MNATFHEDALELHSDANIGVGTALGNEGLIVPVIHHAQGLSLPQIAARFGQLVTAARAGELAPQEVRGGTFTLSNHGVGGSLLAAPIVNTWTDSRLAITTQVSPRATAAGAGRRRSTGRGRHGSIAHDGGPGQAQGDREADDEFSTAEMLVALDKLVVDRMISGNSRLRSKRILFLVSTARSARSRARQLVPRSGPGRSSVRWC